MLNKEQELKQWRDFIETIEPKGYLAMTLEGMTAYVERNIQDDTGYNPINTVGTLEKKIEGLESCIKRMDDDKTQDLSTIDQQKAEIDDLKQQLSKVVGKLNTRTCDVERLEAALKTAKEDTYRHMEDNAALFAENKQIRSENAKQEQELIEVKAKAYDLIIEYRRDK